MQDQPPPEPRSAAANDEDNDDRKPAAVVTCNDETAAMEEDGVNGAAATANSTQATTTFPTPFLSNNKETHGHDHNNNNNTNINNNNPSFVPWWQSQEFQTALHHAVVDPSDKADLMHALHVVPHLVAQETPWERFVAVEDGHMERACQRLAKYWKMRRHLFSLDDIATTTTDATHHPSSFLSQEPSTASLQETEEWRPPPSCDDPFYLPLSISLVPLDDYAPGTADGPNDQHPPDDHPPPQRQSAFNAMDMDVFRTGVPKFCPRIHRDALSW